MEPLPLNTQRKLPMYVKKKKHTNKKKCIMQLGNSKWKPKSTRDLRLKIQLHVL